LAGEWLTNLTNEGAWDEMNDVVGNEPGRAWRIIRAVVGSAPDYDVLSAIAAGPVENLISKHGDSVMPILVEEAKRSARVRICLGATYSEFPPELDAMIEAETADVRDVPTDDDVQLAGKDLALFVSWLRHSDSAWAPQFLEEMTNSDPAAAWDVLGVLAIFAEEDARIRADVYANAFTPFMRRHFDDHREKLVILGRKSAAFRQWARDRKRSPIEDAAKWDAFVAELA
ncbi:MAG TPA: hypothetical protein VEU30_17175, partial [Thermoanaerobaculia bacterium]|nr:hypothetical protein [Thermoanaerobaculia bacterium]